MSSSLPPSSGDLELLAWLAEQYGASRDQIMRLLHCSGSALCARLKRLRASKLVDDWRIFVEEPSWITPTARGLRACGSPFSVWAPRLGTIPHISAVTEVRLHVQWRDPTVEWICERQLKMDRASRAEHLPDAVVVADGKRVAIEVELSVKTRRRLEGIFDELTARHDAVLYFCTPTTERVVSSLARSGCWPSLGVRPLPGSRRRWMR